MREEVPPISSDAKYSVHEKVMYFCLFACSNITACLCVACLAVVDGCGGCPLYSTCEGRVCVCQPGYTWSHLSKRSCIGNVGYLHFIFPTMTWYKKSVLKTKLA